MASLLHYTLNNAPSVRALMDEVRESELRGTIQALSTHWTNRYYNVQNGADASTGSRTSGRSSPPGARTSRWSSSRTPSSSPPSSPPSGAPRCPTRWWCSVGTWTPST
ncbi:hypothetical protein ACN28S_07170 [Cystobacter fuscus]